MTASNYIDTIESAVLGHRHIFSADPDDRRQRLFALGRDIGYGLGVYSDDEIQKEVTRTYITIVVRNSFDRAGPVLDNAEWVATIRTGVTRRRAHGATVGLQQVKE